MTLCVGIAGMGAIGSRVADFIQNQSDLPITLTAISETAPCVINLPNLSFIDLAKSCDVVIEALPVAAVPALAQAVFTEKKTLVCISSAAILLYPEILDAHKNYGGRLIVPSGALVGLDGVTAMRAMDGGITRAYIHSTKPPAGLKSAAYFIKNPIDWDHLDSPKIVFQGHALDAAAAFPANVNVAASLCLSSGLTPEDIEVTLIADPAAQGNNHRIYVENPYTRLESAVYNIPTIDNPKTSALTAYSIIACLQKLISPFSIG